MTVEITNSITPTFDQIGPLCQGSTPPDLPEISNNGIRGTWEPSTISTSSTGSRQYIFTPDYGQCASPVTMTVEITNSITPTFDQIGPLCQGSTPPDLPEISNNGIRGTWEPETINTSSTGSRQYTFTPDDGQCSSSYEMTIEVLHDSYIKIPNAFSPNGDGINDVWNISGITNYPGATVKVYNRWGKKIWVSDKGYPIPWDGKSNGTKLPVDSYHYVIEINNGKKPIVGHVTIVR